MYPDNPSTYSSNNKIYTLTVTPPPSKKRNKRECVAVLTKSETNKAKQVVWRAALVNPVAPLEAMVTNTGSFVVTFDNWFGAGTDPIVIYDSKGRLIFRHNLESLGLMKYVDGRWVAKGENGLDAYNLELKDAYIKRSMSSAWWRENAMEFFGREERNLIIRLHWGMLLGVELSTGRILEDAELKALKAEIDEKIQREVLLLLASDDGGEQAQGALIAGQEKYMSAIPRLRELLKSNESHTRHNKIITWQSRPNEKEERLEREERKYEYYVRKASLEALTALGEKVEGVILEEDIPDKNPESKNQDSRL